MYSSCPEQHFEEIYFSWWFFSSLDFDQKFCALWQRKLSEVFKTSFYVSRRSVFLSKSLEKGQVFSFLVFTANFFGNFVKSVLVFSIATFWGKTVFLSKIFFPFWDSECKFHALWKNKPSEVVEISFFASKRSFFSYQKLEKAHLFRFIVLTAKICKSFLAVWSIVYLYCPL